MVDDMQLLVIDIMKGFANALDYANHSVHRDEYKAAIHDDIVIVAEAFQKHFPDFDINEFYYKCGYHEFKKSSGF